MGSPEIDTTRQYPNPAYESVRRWLADLVEQARAENFGLSALAHEMIIHGFALDLGRRPNQLRLQVWKDCMKTDPRMAVRLQSHWRESGAVAALWVGEILEKARAEKLPMEVLALELKIHGAALKSNRDVNE
jgi:hypothetical protein